MDLPTAQKVGVPPEQVLENFAEGVLILDTDGYISYCNPRAAGVLGYTTEQLTGQPLHVIYGAAEENIRTSYELSQARKEGRFVSNGWKTDRNGKPVWCSLVIVPLFRQDRHAGYSCLLRDASEEMTKEVDLRNSEQRYRLMVDGVKDYCIFMLDPNGYILTWNEGAQRTKGYTPNEIIGKHFSIFYTAEDLADGKPPRELNIAIETGRYEEEGWRVKKNGSLFWTNIVITALFDEKNRLMGFSKVTRDLSDRRQKEEQLRQSEERYRSLVEQVTDYGIFMMDETGRIVSWNEGARRIKGYTANEIIGKRFTMFYPEEDLINGKPAHELKVATETGKYEEEGWRLRKDGTRFWANVVITAVYNEAGILIGFSKVTRDLTERKEAERALRESYDKYRQLTGQLRAANDELSYTNRELEQFTSIVSHDLQEPIRTIKSFLSLIDTKYSTHIGNEGHGYVRKSILAAGRMQELIRNLLNYSQLSKNELIEAPVAVQDLVNEVMNNLRTSIDSKNAVLQTHLQVENVWGDSIQLVQLLQNLVGNSLKFIENRTPQVLIRCIESNGKALFSVSDNGIGINPEDLHKVFDIFRRLHTEKEYPGTGIGLAICKKIVDRHGGEIWVESEKDKGTTFYFTLRIA